jgi:hypothetical protein
MFDWVENCPPRHTPRDVLGVEMFDDRVPGGFRITYILERGTSEYCSFESVKLSPASSMGPPELTCANSMGPPLRQ